MKYVLIKNGVVVQVQPYEEDGFVQAPSNVVAGMLFKNGEYTAPPISPTNYSTATKLSVVRYLKSVNQWAAIKSAIESDADMYEEWLLSNELLITDPAVQAMKAMQGWTDQQVQDLFNVVN